MNKVLTKTASFLAVGILAGLSAPADNVIERDLTLKPDAAVWSRQVCLHDLVQEAWIRGRCAMEANRCCHWKLEERSREFTREELDRTLMRYGIPGLKIRLGGSDAITVTQAGRELLAAEIQAKIQSQLAARFGDAATAPGAIQFSSMKVPVPLYVTFEAENDWDVLLPENIGERVAVKVISTRDSSQVVGWVNATVALHGETYVAVRKVPSTSFVRPEDFELRRVNLLAPQWAAQPPFRKGQFPEGMRARQTISEGMVLTSLAVERVPLVRLGDTVTLILRSDNLRISTKGVVQGPAAIGDMVTVQIQRYSRTFRGRLLENKLVEVWL